MRDPGLLLSALARPQKHYAYASSDIVELAALCIAGIVRNHPFTGGNKHTGFVIGVLFLELNGIDFKASEEDATQAVMDLAAGKLNEHSYVAWLRANIARKR